MILTDLVFVRDYFAINTPSTMLASLAANMSSKTRWTLIEWLGRWL